MASTVATDVTTSKMKIYKYDHDPNSTAATDVGFVDMRDYGHFTAVAFASALTGTGATAFTIVANSNSAGTGDEVEIKAHAVGSAPDAVGDWLVLECSAQEIADLGRASGYALRYVSAKITLNNAADEQVVTYILTEPRFAYDGLTADTVA